LSGGWVLILSLEEVIRIRPNETGPEAV